MTEKANNEGLQWRKLDLHVHSSVSYDFHVDMSVEDMRKVAASNGWMQLTDVVEGSDDWWELRHRIVAASIVQEAIEKGLDAIAITDHDTGSGIDYVKDAAKSTNLIIFPGVEITCMGGKDQLHLIALFDTEKNSEHVNAALHALGVPPNQLGLANTYVNKTPLDVIKIIQDEKWEGILIPAHVSSTHGLLRMKGTQRTDLVRSPYLLGVEARDFHKDNKRAVDWFDGNDPVYQRKLAVYQASDNPCDEGHGHCVTGVGSCCAYFKMEQINLESLRQCLADSDVRIRQDFELELSQYPFIRRIEIVGGFLDGTNVEFHCGLNSILGGPGAGKSLLVEIMRFALDQISHHPAILQDHKSKLEKRFQDYGTVTISLIDQTGKELTFSRQYRPIEDHPYHDNSVNPSQVFPVLFLSQNEILRIAESENAQLEFIDQFFDFRRYQVRLNNLERELQELDHQLAESLRASLELKKLQNQLASAQENLDRLNRALSAPIFEEYQQLESKARTFEVQVGYIEDQISRLQRTRHNVLSETVPELPKNLQQDPGLLRASDTLRAAQLRLDEYLTALLEDLNGLKERVSKEYLVWEPQFREGKKKYQEHMQKMGGDYAELVLRREDAVTHLTRLQRRYDNVSKKYEDLREIAQQRNTKLDELQDIYSQYTAERKSKCEMFEMQSGGKLRLKILDSSNVDEFRRRLLQLKRGSYLRDEEIDRICTRTTPRQFIGDLLRYQVSMDATKLQPVADAAEIELPRMKVLADFLLEELDGYEEILELQYRAHPQDQPQILYNVGTDEFELLSDVSVGQKSTAMLIMALSDGTMPIVIDQPEDSVDVRSIWEDMCKKLRDRKEQRQFIFTTHNSSVAVASDTDYFIIMEGTSSQGRVVHSGSMDHAPVSEDVLNYLEGGIKTYRRKYTKYKVERRFKDNQGK